MKLNPPRRRAVLLGLSLAILVACGSAGTVRSGENREQSAGTPNAINNLHLVPIIDLEIHRQFSFGIGMIAASPDSSVLATLDGRVHALSDDPANPTNLGRFVLLQHERPTRSVDGTIKIIKWYSLYALLGSIDVNTAEPVKRGQRIGTVGPSGPLAAFDPGASCMFGMYTRDRFPELESLWGPSEKFYGVYWYDPRALLGPDRDEGR